jgi:hypothetical protein
VRHIVLRRLPDDVDEKTEDATREFRRVAAAAACWRHKEEEEDDEEDEEEAIIIIIIVLPLTQKRSR